MSQLHVEPLKKAIDQLAVGLSRAHNAPLDELMRDGVIQRFEYTMDLSWKLIQRHLKDVAQVEDSVIRSKKDLFREAARLGLIPSAENWIKYYEARNQSSHTYNAVTAQQVFEQAELFLADVTILLHNLSHAP